MAKKKLTLTVNENIIAKAKKLDINISSFLEENLTKYIAIMEGVCSRRDLNPSLRLERP